MIYNSSLRAVCRTSLQYFVFASVKTAPRACSSKNATYKRNRGRPMSKEQIKRDVFTGIKGRSNLSVQTFELT